MPPYNALVNIVSLMLHKQINLIATGHLEPMYTDGHSQATHLTLSIAVNKKLLLPHHLWVFFFCNLT